MRGMTPSLSPLRKVRDRAAASISPSTAAAAGMSFEQLRGFICGAYHPTEDQLEALRKGNWQ